MQRPPRYSAVRVDGKRAYELARAGVEFELPERPVHVYDLEITALDLPRVSCRMKCGSGTYVRSIARDMGEALGSAAHTLSIRRTSVGEFGIEQAVTLDHLAKDETHITRARSCPLRVCSGACPGCAWMRRSVARWGWDSA